MWTKYSIQVQRNKHKIVLLKKSAMNLEIMFDL